MAEPQTTAGDTKRIDNRAFAARVVAHLVNLYPPPRLTPDQARELDSARQYQEWQASSVAETFQRLDAAGHLAQASEDDALRAWQTVTRIDADAVERRDALSEVTPLITDHADALSVVWGNLDAPFCLPPMRTWDEPIAHFAGFRALARLLVLDAHRRLSQGDWDGALEMSLIGLRFGLQIARGSNLIGRMVSCEIQAMCRRALWAALPQANPLPLRAALHDLQAALVLAPPLSETIAEERKYLQRTLLRGWEASGPVSDIEGIEREVVRPTRLIAGLQGKQKVFDQCGAYLHKWEGNVCSGSYCYVLERPDLPFTVAPSLRQDIEGTYFGDTLQTTQNHLILAALALHLYRAERQRWPASLADLVPRYLQSVPTDPFSRRYDRLRYRLDGTGYLLYSIGPNGNDDGGKAITRTLPVIVTGDGRAWESVSGDIVAGVNL